MPTCQVLHKRAPSRRPTAPRNGVNVSTGHPHRVLCDSVGKHSHHDLQRHKPENRELANVRCTRNREACQPAKSCTSIFHRGAQLHPKTASIPQIPCKPADPAHEYKPCAPAYSPSMMRWMLVERPVMGSQLISAAHILGLPLAASNLPGMPVRKRCSTNSFSTPMTLS